MRRQIKFRIWDGENMFFPDDNSRVVLEYNKISGWNLRPNVVDKNSEYICGDSQSKKDFKMMQLVNYKDKQGTEVYEGDIIELPPFDDEKRLGNVNYRTDISSFVVDEGGGWDSIELIQNGIIIGNIYENPNLLKI